VTAVGAAACPAASSTRTWSGTPRASAANVTVSGAATDTVRRATPAAGMPAEVEAGAAAGEAGTARSANRGASCAPAPRDATATAATAVSTTAVPQVAVGRRRTGSGRRTAGG
jgi:hypothetical protein